jgi:hypothetical protein
VMMRHSHGDDGKIDLRPARHRTRIVEEQRHAIFLRRLAGALGRRGASVLISNPGRCFTAGTWARAAQQSRALSPMSPTPIVLFVMTSGCPHPAPSAEASCSA